MARRPGGKAASRKARQRRAAQRSAASSASATPAARRPVESPAPAPTATAPPAAPEPRRVSAPSAARAFSTSSSLTGRERAEYHYVERDLRSIGILTALIVVLLLAAWAIFNALGLVG